MATKINEVSQAGSQRLCLPLTVASLEGHTAVDTTHTISDAAKEGQQRLAHLKWQSTQMATGLGAWHCSPGSERDMCRCQH